MEFVEFIVELSDHLLDVMRLLFLIKLVNDSLLDISLSIALDDCASRTNDLLLSDLGRDRVLSQDGLDTCIFIVLEHVDVSVVNIVHCSFVNLRHGSDSKWPFGSIAVNAWVRECVSCIVVLIGLNHLLWHLAYVDDLIRVIGLTFAVECIYSSTTHLLLPDWFHEWCRGSRWVFQVVNHRLTLSFHSMFDLDVGILQSVRSVSVVEHILLDIVLVQFVE